MSQFSYTAKEAFEMTKEHFPMTWLEEIQKCKETLLRLKRTYKKDLVQAYQHYLNMGCRPESRILMLAALFWIQKEESEYKANIAQQVQDLRNMQIQIINQSQANETSNENAKDKGILRQFYTGKQNELQGKIDKLVNSIEVACAEVVIIQHKLFNDLQS